MTWEAIQRVRMVVQMVIGLAIEVYDNLPHHLYAEGAAIGLGVLFLTVAEVIIRWLAARRVPPYATLEVAPQADTLD